MTNRAPRTATADAAEAWATLDANATRARELCDLAGVAWSGVEDAVGFRQSVRALALLERATKAVREDLAARIKAATPDKRQWMRGLMRRDGEK
jgi:hypothetical protein